MGLKTIISQEIFGFGIKRSFSLRLSSHLLFYMDVKFGVEVYPKSHGGRLNKSKISL